MKFKKKKLAELEKCYAIAPLCYKGAECFLVAAEKRERCLLFGAGGDVIATVWDGPGGVMSMEQLPGIDGAFLSTQKFYSPNDSAAACLVAAFPQGNTWRVRQVADLPFVHRFAIVESGGKRHLVASTIKSAHAFKDDWSCPGRVWAAELPDRLDMLGDNEMLAFEPILSGLTKNHGFFCRKLMGEDRIYVGAENGIIEIVPPGTEHGWQFQQILDEPTSDLIWEDLDADGNEELITFSPFHGEQLRVYKQENGGLYPVYTHPEPLPFLHAICAGRIGGHNAVVVGHRRGECEFAVLTCEDGVYKFTVIDRGVGAANAIVYQRNGKAHILSANREVDEVALYVED